jgi:SOS-response transcriptional repressor LexA
MPEEGEDRIRPDSPGPAGSWLAGVSHDQLADALIDLVARAEIRRPDSAYFTNERFIAWLERDLNSPERRREGWPAWKVAEVADRIRARVMARKLGVTVRSGTPAQSKGAVTGTIPQVLDDAAAARAAPQLDLAAAAGAGRDLWDEACEDWVELPAELPAGKYVALRVAGDSMAPLLHAGDTVLVRLGTVVKPDTVVLARLPEGGYVIKWAGKANARRLELRSVNEAYRPIQLVRNAHAVVGTVVMRWCEHGHHDPPGSRQRR